jgi:hypothetical protein
MSVELLKSLYFDIQTLKNAENDAFITETLTDAIDLVQVASEAIIPYFCNNVIFELSDTVYTKVLKNGNEKNYTVFSLACKAIREYITAQQTTQNFKKLHYVIGYTDTGKEITTTKKPVDTLENIELEKVKEFFVKCNLTTAQQEVIVLYMQWTDSTKGKKRKYTLQEIANKLNISVDSAKDRLKLALKKINSIK